MIRAIPSGLWNYSEQNYVDDDMEEGEININTFQKRGPKLYVKKI